MLVLGRKAGESIYLGDDIVVTIVAIRGKRITLGIQAPSCVTVHRMEVIQRDELRTSQRQGLPTKETSFVQECMKTPR